MKKIHTILSFLIFFLFGNLLLANNITVSNCTLTGQNTSAGANNPANFSLVQFDLSWENSWRLSVAPANWDAAWVFVKFQVGASDPAFTGVSSSGTTITISSTANLRVGMPVRVTAGTGAFAATTVISSITNATQFVVSAAPTTALSNASIICLRIWEHARLNNTGHTAPSGSSIDAGLLTPDLPFDPTTNPALGVFIYRSTIGGGTNTFTNTQLRWNYGANGITDNMVIRVQVFAIEMVHVPGGVNFNVGGGGGSSAFTSTTINTATANTLPIGTGSLGGQAGGYPTGQTAPVANWPNGYNAFYCMKYEMSQGQYRDFLNSLTYNQQATRTAVAPNSVAGTGALQNFFRNGLDIQTPGNATTRLPAVYGCNLNGNTTYNEAADGEWIACIYISWMDGCAYMDWAGLRPMTEMEFEKACRGNLPAVSGEYAWGTATVHATSYAALTNSGAANELPNSPSTTNGNASYGTTTNIPGVFQSPLRVGIFATGSSNRVTSGAAYYGIMEMSGNAFESVVGISTTQGRAFTGAHGDGALSNAGNATTANWPGLTSGEVTAASGTAGKGGDWSSAAGMMGISDRSWFQNPNSARSYFWGFRGVRSVQ